MLQYIPLCNTEFIVTFIKSAVLQGQHCCLYCEISIEEMKISQNEREKSTPCILQPLANNYKKFTDLGSDIKNTNLCNNVIDKFMFNIPIEQVIN